MGLTDAVGGIVDKAAGALGVGDSKSGPKPEAGKPEFKRKDPLDLPKEKKPLAVGPNGNDTPPNTAQPPDVIEFVHYGYVHDDTTDHFVHPKFDNDQKKDEKKEEKKADDADKDKEKDKKPAGRGILYRDAVEREMILLHGFITATKTVHEELKKNQGLAGAAAGAIGSLLGDSGKEPEPGSLKQLLDDITKAGGKINADSCEYIKIHKAAIDVHQTRSDYTKYCKEKLNAYYLEKSQKGADGKSPTALLTSLPGVAGAAKTVFGILFKAFDIYFGMYLAMREKYERPIEDVCHDFSFKVVKEYSAPTFACWFAKPKEEKKKPAKSTLPSVLADAENKYNEGKQEVVDAAGVEEKKPAPGEDAVKAIFAILGSGPSATAKEADKDKAKDKEKEKEKKDDKPDPAKKEETVPIPMPAEELCVGAFNSVLGTTLPGFLAKAIGKIVWANVEYLQVVYLKICNDPTQKLDVQWLNDRAHETVFNRLYSFIEDSVGFIKKAEDFNFDAMGQKLGPQKLVDKGKDELTHKVGGYADPVLKLAVGRMADVFENLRSSADGNKSLTMETFLGHLPFLLAFQVRNCTFPLWKTIIDESLGKGNSALSAAMKPVTDFLGDAKDFTEDTKDYKDRVAKGLDKFDKEGANLGSGGQNIADYKNIATTSTKKKDDAAGGGGSFPGGSRTATGTGTKIPADDIDKAKKDRKDPWPAQ